MTVRYKAELDLLGEYVTFVNGGEPMINELTYRPYPLPLPFSQQQLNAMEDFSLLHGSLGVRDGEVVPRSALPLLYLRVAANDSAATSPAWLTPDSTSVDLAEEMAARAALSSEAREDLLAHETALRRRAAYTAAHPPALMTHQWERYLRKAFSGQGEYVFRAVFMYPHNGSVMRDVFNEDILVAVDNYIHYYSTPQQLFTSLKKSVRVFEDVMRREVLAHCS